VLPSEKGALLNQSEGEEFYRAFYRAPVGVTLVSGIITITGSGFYRVSPESGVTDDLTGITVTSENVEGMTCHLEPAAVGQTIIIRHQGNIHLINGQDAILATIYSGIWLRHRGSSVFYELMPRTSIP
jgi:hypothetical protein